MSRLIIILYMLTLWLIPGHTYADSHSGSAESKIVGSVSIRILNPPGNRETWESMARKLIYIRENEPYSSNKLISAVSALRGCGKFKSVAVDSSLFQNRVTFTFTLEPFLIIRKIVVVRGYFPLFESDILKAMTIRSGGVYSVKIIETQKQLIENLYRKEGYSNAVAKIEVKEYRQEGCVDLRILTEKGLPVLLKEINFTGNKEYAAFRLKLRMRTWRRRLIPFNPRRYIKKIIEEDIKRLTAFYRKGISRRSYPECQIKYTINIYPEENRAVLNINIDEGPYYVLKYKKSDKSSLSKRMKRGCKRAVIIYNKGNRNDLGLRKSMQNMKQMYYESGHAHSRIHFRDTTYIRRKKQKKVVTFLVDEGPRTSVESLVVTGNETLSHNKIEKQMLTTVSEPFVLETLLKDLDAIASLYRKKGFRDAKVTHTLSFNSEKSDVAVSVDIKEEARTRVAEIVFDTLSVISEAKARKIIKMKPGRPYRRALVRSDEIVLSAAIAKKGYPYVTINHRLEKISDTSAMRLVYRIDEGTRVYIGSMFFAGNFKTKSWAIKRELGIKRGQKFSLKKMLSRQKTLRNLNIFNSVAFRTVGLKERRDTVHLFIETEERRPYYTQLGLGYEQDLFWGQIRAGDRNLFGLIRNASVGARLTEAGGYRFDFDFTQHRLFGYRVKNVTQIYYEREIESELDFGVDIFGASIGMSRKVFRYFTPALGLAYERRNQFGSPQAASAGESMNRYLITMSPSLTYDKRDSNTRPKKGAFSNFTLTFSKGIAKNSLDNFLKYHYELRFFVTPVKKVTIATIGRVGYLDPIFDNEEIPQDQLFFLGGTRDVRGFNENELRTNGGDPVGGRAALNGSIEARFDLGKNFELPLFFDIGRIQNSFTISFDQFRSAAGLGLRYITPIGPVGLLYGFKLNGKRTRDDIGRLHFSLGYTF